MTRLSEVREYCRTFPGAVEDMPFGEGTLVCKVGGKIFILLDTDAEPLWINLKCDPLLAEEFRDRFASVSPGYHMNKRYWNTVVLDGNVPDEMLRKMIAHSWELVFCGLPRRVREMLTPGSSQNHPDN
jgi:predicted DNA-binding protein (MmcQ/YjbR family)